MPVKLHPEKIVTIPYQDKDDKDFNFSITFKFPYTEDDPLKDGEEPINYVLRLAEKGIIKTEGIIDEITGKEMELTENSKKAIYDLIRTLPEYVMCIAAAFLGPKGKNLLTGATLSLTTDGHPVNVDRASTVNVD